MIKIFLFIAISMFNVLDASNLVPPAGEWKSKIVRPPRSFPCDLDFALRSQIHSNNKHLENELTRFAKLDALRKNERIDNYKIDEQLGDSQDYILAHEGWNSRLKRILDENSQIVRARNIIPFADKSATIEEKAEIITIIPFADQIAKERKRKAKKARLAEEKIAAQEKKSLAVTQQLLSTIISTPVAPEIKISSQAQALAAAQIATLHKKPSSKKEVPKAPTQEELERRKQQREITLALKNPKKEGKDLYDLDAVLAEQQKINATIPVKIGSNSEQDFINFFRKISHGDVGWTTPRVIQHATDLNTLQGTYNISSTKFNKLLKTNYQLSQAYKDALLVTTQATKAFNEAAMQNPETFHIKTILGLQSYFDILETALKNLNKQAKK
jgi:hypothetical protein